MADKPNSYNDPYWSDLSAQTEAKLGLPAGLLAAVVTKGERSNNDQVSEVGARTPFQITPQTRKDAIDKYGVDPYLNPENAAEVAGRLLKDSLDRNKGDIATAVAEYHGGTDPANWGAKTRSYVNRVMVAQKQAQPDLPDNASTFQKALANVKAMAPQGADVIAPVYQAYKEGRMTPEEKTQFESDVKSGLVMLPRGAVLGDQPAPSPTAKPEAVLLPPAVTDAYVSGNMTDQERADLERDMRAGLVKLPAQDTGEVPGGPRVGEQGIIDRSSPSLGQRLVGAGEAALTTGTGMTGGAVGMVGGTVKGVAQSMLDGTFGTPEAAQLVEQQAAEGANALTYQPRTATGQEYATNVGEGMQQLVPFGPLAGESAMLANATRAAAPAVAATTRTAAVPIVAGAGRAAEMVQSGAMKTVDAVKNAPSRAAELVGLKEPAISAPTPGTAPSVGAAGTDVATMRRMDAEALPVPVQLTEGQASRDFGQLRFEQEAAKNPDLGAPIRERMMQQNAAVRQSFDAWIDETGAQAPDTRAVGIAVDKALNAKAARDKAEIRVAYKEAEKAGETMQPVSTQAVVDALNESTSAESTAPVLTAAKKELVRLGGAIEDADGNLVARDMTLGNTEQLRKFVNKVTGNDPTNIKFAGDVKRAIDASTEGAGGELYQKARGLRAKYAEQYENRAVIADLLNTKRGMSDRKVALEDVFDRVVFRGSLDDVKFAGKTLKSAGEDGVQAWNEIKGQAVRYIRDEATKNVQRDAMGNEIISPAALDKAIKRLDGDGKLDYLFGKKGAEQLRSVNDLAKVMFTTPPGAVNTSNTASVLLAAMDMAISGSAGLPLPVMSGLRLMIKNVKDRKLRAQIQHALQGKPTNVGA